MTRRATENSCTQLFSAAGAMQARAELTGTDAQLTAAAADRAPLLLLGTVLRR